jgi:8-oxo-dGTP diphosphatase
MGAQEQGADAIEGRWITIPRTLCFVLNGDDVLLMRRAAHKRVFPNRYNGVGGHIERGEDPYTSARREIFEETGLAVQDLRLRAVYNVDAGEATGIMVFTFTAISEDRAVIASDEGTLHWIPRHAVLQYDLVEDLPIVLPHILEMRVEDNPLFIHVSYDQDDCMQLRIAETN